MNDQLSTLGEAAAHWLAAWSVVVLAIVAWRLVARPRRAAESIAVAPEPPLPKGGERVSAEQPLSTIRNSEAYYHVVLERIPPRAEPSFESPGMQERVWGRVWGVSNDINRLRLCALHRPGPDETG